VRELPPRRHEYLPARGDTETELVYAPASEEPQLRDYWKMLAKRRRLILLVLLAVICLGILITALSPRLYTATVTLKIDSTVPSATGTAEVAGRIDDYYQTQLALLKSRALAAKVVKALDLPSNPNFVSTRDPISYVRSQVMRPMVVAANYVSDFVSKLQGDVPKRAVGSGSGARPEFELGVHPAHVSRYLGFLKVEPVKSTSLATVQFTTPDPRLSQELAAAHAATFIRMSLETRFELTKEAREFLEKKLAELKVKVEKSEEALQQFRQRHGVVSMEGSQNIVVDRMLDLNKRLTEARAKRIDLESLARIVKEKNVESLSQVIGNGLIVQLKGRLEEMEAEQAKLATIYKSDHPRLVELRQQINEARRRLKLEIGNVVRAVESDYSSARAREVALQEEAARQQQAALSLKEMEVQYTLVQGELNANRTLYDNVAKHLNERSISSDSPVTTIQIVEPAEIPLFPSFPRTPTNMVVATAMGLLLGVGVAFLAEHFDSTMRTPEDVWHATAVPTLGVVPHLKALARREYGFGRFPKGPPLHRLADRWAAGGQSFSSSLMVAHHPLSFLAESYRTIRTALLLGQGESSPKVILVTSSQPGEGKTTITLNLGITLAQSGRSVVVVDADLRKGNCHSHLAVPNRYGLTHLLRDDLPLEVCVQSTAVPGFSLLTRGGVPSNPTDLLASDKMQEMLELLRQRFDFVLIDTPPAIAISDAAVLSVLSDGVLLVVRNQNTSVDTVRHLVESLQAVGAPILGTVLNAIDIQHPYYSDYRHYYSSYYTSAQKDVNRSR
jgi:succinoglycan biosynthesis transport protein ExoP